MTSGRFSGWQITATLDFRGPIMRSLKRPGTTSYRLSIDTIALNCLVFEKISFFCILATDRQTNRWTALMHKATLAIESGSLIKSTIYLSLCVPVKAPKRQSVHCITAPDVPNITAKMCKSSMSYVYTVLLRNVLFLRKKILNIRIAT